MTDERPPTEAELLAPWSLTRKLSDAEEAMVQAAMETPDFAHQMSLVEDERRSSVEISERIPGPSRKSLDTLMDMIDAEPKRSPSLLSKLISAFNSFGISGAPAGAAMAALAVTVFVQGGLLTQSGLDDPTENVAPIEIPAASAPQGSTRNILSGEEVALRVIFKPEATIGEVAALLESLDGQIVSGPVQDFYTVTFETSASATMAISVLNSNDAIVVTAQPQE